MAEYSLSWPTACVIWSYVPRNLTSCFHGFCKVPSVLKVLLVTPQKMKFSSLGDVPQR